MRGAAVGGPWGGMGAEVGGRRVGAAVGAQLRVGWQLVLHQLLLLGAAQQLLVPTCQLRGVLRLPRCGAERSTCH